MRTRDENKERVIRQKAMEMIVREGLDRFGINKLAKAAGVSPATIYIYYKDKDELIRRLSLDTTTEMLADSLRNFDPEMHFEEGLKVQWLNRASYFLKHPLEVQFIEQIRYSPYYDEIGSILIKKFGEVMGQFKHNAIKRKEVVELSFEAYWSVAFAPLYQLIKFHTQKTSFAGRKFKLTNKIMMETFGRVVKAFQP